MIERDAVIAALVAYRAHLKDKGQHLKAAAVDQCLVIVRRLGRAAQPGAD